MDAGQSLNMMTQVGVTGVQTVIKLEDLLAVAMERLGDSGKFFIDYMNTKGDIDSRKVNKALLPILAMEFDKRGIDFLVIDKNEISTSKRFLTEQIDKATLNDLANETVEIKFRAGITEKDSKGNRITRAQNKEERFLENDALGSDIQAFQNRFNIPDSVLDESDQRIYSIDENEEQIEDALLVHYYSDMFHEATFSWDEEERIDPNKVLEFYEVYTEQNKDLELIVPENELSVPENELPDPGDSEL